MDEERLIELLKKTAYLLEFNDENKFKILAYQKGTEIIESFEGKFFEMYNSGTYKNIKGIGKGLQEFIVEFANTGTSKIYEVLLEKAPNEIFEIIKIKGLGIKKLKAIYDTLKIETLNQLEQSCKSLEILAVKGISEKFAADTLKEIDRIKRDKNKVLLGRADRINEDILGEITSLFNGLSISVVGEFARNMEVISRLEYVVNNYDDSFINYLKTNFDFVEEIKSDLYTELVCNYKKRILVIFYLVNNSENYNFICFQKTGSDEFLEKYIGNVVPDEFKNENELFKSKNLFYLNPEVREIESLEYLDKLTVNSNLQLDDIKGLIHFHTQFSDGVATPEEMVEEAVKQGLIYQVISDHSKTAVYANGLTENRILQQHDEIIKLRKKGYNLFHSIESDILPDGNLDYDEEVLKSLDFVIASVHSRFDMTKEEMTSRIIKAIENPYTDLIGHVSGRVLLRRKAYELDIYKILDACVANDVAIEINSAPSRLDLDWRYIYYAREKGCKFSIDPDAHATSEISVIKYGVKIARKGGIQKEEVINAMDLDSFINYINRKNQRKFNRGENGLERIN